jgi:uncharacterized membrane protein
MNKDQQLKDLRLQIERLSSEMELYKEKLHRLETELSDIETGNDHHIENKPGKDLEDSKVESFSEKKGIENFIGLRLMHVIGIVVLVIGLSIGVKYAVDKELISQVTRIALAYTAGSILFFLSLLLRKKYQLFSSILFSGAMASLYFTTYAAFTYYNLLSFGTTFIIMVIITVCTSYTATIYNKQEIGLLGMVGAYAIPFLISANSEKVELFFSYILLINTGVVFLSIRKAWKEMSQLALLVTWILFIGWLYTRYEKGSLVIAIVIMSIFYSMFLLNAFFIRSKGSRVLPRGAIHILGVNNLALYISSLLIFSYGKLDIGISITTLYVTIVLAIFTLASIFLFPADRLLQKTLAIQSLTLLILFIMFQWTGMKVTLIWASISSLLFIVGLYSRQYWLRLSAVVLMTLTLGKLLSFDINTFTMIQKIISFIVIGCLLLIVSFLYQKLKHRVFLDRK